MIPLRQKKWDAAHWDQMKCSSFLVPSWVIDWDTVFKLGHSPVQAVQTMLCTAWIGECPNLKTVVQSMTHDGNSPVHAQQGWCLIAQSYFYFCGLKWNSEMKISTVLMLFKEKNLPNFFLLLFPFKALSAFVIINVIINKSKRATQKGFLCCVPMTKSLSPFSGFAL